MPPLFAALAAIFLAYALRKWYQRFAHRSLDIVPGPPSKSWLWGNFYNFLSMGKVGADWLAAHDSVLRLRNPFGQNLLIVSDPKAIQYIIQSEYAFPRAKGYSDLAHAVVGPALLWADGETHKRHRRVMLPAFSAAEIRSFVPVMTSTAEHMTSKWEDMVNVSNEDDSSVIVNILDWTFKASLDIVGQAALSQRLGSLDGEDDGLAATVQHVLYSTYGPSKAGLAFLTVSQVLPVTLRRHLLESNIFQRMRHAKQVKLRTMETARRLVAEYTSSAMNGEKSRDIIGIVVEANVAENTKFRLTEAEMIAQICSLLVAGSDSTSNSTAWALLELAKHPEVQSRLREEIQMVQERRLEREDASGWSAQDFDDAKYLGAVVKECLRLHPAAPMVFREAGKDCVLPLSKPIPTVSGLEIKELHIPKNTSVHLCISAYNRNKEIFGEDADVFVPERWLVRRKSTQKSFGPFENLFSFSAGVKACIAWRFAVYEMHALLAQIVSKFELLPGPVDLDSIGEQFGDVVTPSVEGSDGTESGLPLKIRPVIRV